MKSVKNKKRVFLLVLISLLVPAVLVLAANAFPGSKNSFGAGDSITSAWANALEDKIGIDSSGDSSSLDYQLNNASSSDPGHQHTKLFSSGYTESLTIEASGNVGIGTSTPATALHVIGTTTLETSIISKLAFDPEVSQTITVASDTVISSASHVDISLDGDFLMTATPSIAAGVDGQILILHSTETTSTLDFQDDSVLSGSDIFLNGADGTLKPASSIMLIYQAASPIGWSILSNPNQSALGASASLLDVRNTSGSSIAAGKCVYASGYNVGLGRTLIALADADDSSKMPCIGLTATIIGNGSNGAVIVSGDAVRLVDTSGQSVGGGVWVSTTAGALVFTRPSVDEIQRIGTITRVNAAGNILVTGAGRTNDIPVNATTTGAYNFGQIIVTGAVQFSNFATGILKVDGSGNLSTSSIPYKAKIAFEDPTADDDFFFGEIATTVTFTSIYCKTLVGTVDLDVTIAGSGINGSDITCTTSGVLVSNLGGDTAGAVGEEVKLAITSVASSPTYLFVQLNGTYDD